jgi:tetrahydromethanopterin S-methyltransferase subunit B
LLGKEIARFAGDFLFGFWLGDMLNALIILPYIFDALSQLIYQV